MEEEKGGGMMDSTEQMAVGGFGESVLLRFGI